MLEIINTNPGILLTIPLLIAQLLMVNFIMLAREQGMKKLAILNQFGSFALTIAIIGAIVYF